MRYSTDPAPPCMPNQVCPQHNGVNDREGFCMMMWNERSVVLSLFQCLALSPREDAESQGWYQFPLDEGIPTYKELIDVFQLYKDVDILWHEIHHPPNGPTHDRPNFLSKPCSTALPTVVLESSTSCKSITPLDSGAQCCKRVVVG